MVKVACASSLFIEKGLDPQGIFTLLLNAVERDIWSLTSNICSHTVIDNLSCQSLLMDVSDSRALAIGKINNAESSFCGDLESAKKRIEQFARDHERIKEIDAELQKFSFWEMLFSRRKQYFKLYAEKDEIESMTIYVSGLMEVAFYRYNQVTGKGMSEFSSELRDFLENERKKFD